MTLRDYVKEKYPEKICGDFYGGVYSCPDQYKELAHIKPHCSSKGCCNDELCTACWNRELVEKEPIRKVEIDVNDVIIAVATLCMKKEEREKTLATFKVFEKYGVKPMDAIKLMEELREVMK